MSASMAEVLAAVLAEHYIVYKWDRDFGENVWMCTSRECNFGTDKFERAITHVAEQLAANGYGKLEEAHAEIEELQEFQNSIASRIPDRYEDDVAQEAIIDRWLDDITSSASEARAQALEDAADALDLPGTDASGYYSGECHSGYTEAERHAETWLRARAVAERGEG